MAEVMEGTDVLPSTSDRPAPRLLTPPDAAGRHLPLSTSASTTTAGCVLQAVVSSFLAFDLRYDSPRSAIRSHDAAA